MCRAVCTPPPPLPRPGGEERGLRAISRAGVRQLICWGRHLGPGRGGVAEGRIAVTWRCMLGLNRLNCRGGYWQVEGGGRIQAGARVILAKDVTPSLLVRFEPPDQALAGDSTREIAALEGPPMKYRGRCFSSLDRSPEEVDHRCGDGLLLRSVVGFNYRAEMKQYWTRTPFLQPSSQQSVAAGC